MIKMKLLCQNVGRGYLRKVALNPVENSGFKKLIIIYPVLLSFQIFIFVLTRSLSKFTNFQVPYFTERRGRG